MGAKEFVNRSKKLIVEYVNKNRDVTDSKEITEDDVYVVWISKVLQIMKLLITATKTKFTLTHIKNGKISLIKFNKQTNKR